MESLFYLRWDKGREAMAAQQRKDKFNLIPFFENGRNQLNYLSLCGRAALSAIWKDWIWRMKMKIFSMKERQQQAKGQHNSIQINQSNKK